MKQSVKLLTVFNIPIEVNYTWFIIFGLILYTLATGYFPARTPELYAPTHWLMALIAALLLFACLLAHEIAHSVVAMRSGLPIHGITLFIFGGVAQLGEEPATPAVEFKMAAAGPLLSIVLASVFFILTKFGYMFGLPLYLLEIMNYLILINLVVAVFNLIPGFPLDGGRLMRAAVWHLTGDLRRATRVASNLGKGFAFLLMGAGLLYLFTGLIVSGVWFIFVGFFLLEAADSSYRQVALKKLLSGVRVGQIMTQNVISVPAELPLGRLVEEYFFRFRYASFPVVKDDRLVGLLTFHAVKEIERSKWPQVTAQEAMLPITPRLTIDQNTELTEALTRLAASGSGRLLVMAGDKLIGILSQRDIMQLFELKTAVEK
jgi:Zn-dependent protease/predicted transcriptional regulator